LLSFFHAAGPTGEGVLMNLKRVFGWIAYLVPFITLVWAVELIRPQLAPVAKLRWIGIILTVVGLAGIIHIFTANTTEALQAALDGRGGGMLGFAVSYPLSVTLSSLAAGLIFVASFLIGLLLTFNVSPTDLWHWFKTFWPQPADSDGLAGGEALAGDVDVPHFHVNAMMSNQPVKADPAQLKLQQQEEEQKVKAKELFKSANKAYKRPSLELLHSSMGRPDSGNIKENAEKIKHTLENFGIPVQMGEVNVGPTVAQYTLRPDEGIKLSRITALQNDLALSLAAHPIRIEAPIPGKNMVGIEIPNKDVALVRLRDLLSSPEFKKAESPLAFGLGKDVTGTTVAATLEKMPHLLVAGATGSGKSVFVNTMLMSLLYRNSPAVMRLILVDPKRVELNVYNGIPHLLTPVIIDPSKTINALKWVVKEMDRRYQVLSEARARNLLSYNGNNPDDALPYIVVVIDELADLMVKYAREVEGAIVRLSQMARAVGIHLVLATQRPSVNVVTGLIKANIPTRVAFHVASQIDSRTILDAAGAEKLLGNGDMLYLSGEIGKPRRLQGAYISEEEVHRVIEAIKTNAEEPQYDESIVTPTRETAAGSGDAGDDELFEEAKQIVVQSGKASASLLQRRLRVGYARAARLLDMLQEHNIISAGEGNKPREVLLRPEAAPDEGIAITAGSEEPEPDSSYDDQW
ncbi:MAG TPA: DNA translocase FtsK 4TM domain-containing protein, partial [Verrucomicrobiae bacterium]|nr:DNA translocase FtsK 4TM domain-containing protein [Verrucomicrobiae bacterium]